MIRKCGRDDLERILEIINDAARAYKGRIPADRWHEPYMSGQELEREISQGVVFWAFEREGKMSGVMGIQDSGEVSLIRHAYVRTAERNRGIGGKLLLYLMARAVKPLLVGPGRPRIGRSVSTANTGFARLTGRRRTAC